MAGYYILPDWAAIIFFICLVGGVIAALVEIHKEYRRPSEEQEFLEERWRKMDEQDKSDHEREE